MSKPIRSKKKYKVSAGFKKHEPKLEHYRALTTAAFYAAASESPSMDFSFATGADINEALISDLNTLRTRIRYELAQNGPAAGIQRVYANMTINTGPTLSIEAPDGFEGWSEEAEFVFSEWSKRCGYIRGESLSEILHLGVREFFDCGEYFIVNKISNSHDTIYNPIRYRCMPIRPDRVSQPMGAPEGTVLGVEFASDSKPVAYYIDKGDYTWHREPSENIRHVFYLEDPEQVRGKPWLSAGLPDLHKRRRYDEARVAAAIVAAKYALFLTNDDPSIEVDPKEILEPGIVELYDGVCTSLPPHTKMQSFSGSQPAAGSSDFRREMIANAGAAVGMSSNAANQDSSNSNFASAKFDSTHFEVEQNILRNLIVNRDLDPMCKIVLDEAAALREIGPLPSWLRFVWRWPVLRRHTDPLKIAMSEEKRLESGISTYAEVWGENGVSKEQRRAEILEEITWAKINNIKHPLILEGKEV